MNPVFKTYTLYGKVSYFTNYAMHSVKIKGFTNDTIKMTYGDYTAIKLSGKIDTLSQSDYYGTHNIIITFDPYKATKGNLSIEYKL